MIKKQLETLLHQLDSVSRRMREQNESLYADKVQDLMRKMVHEEFGIAFCGHFSAGKSSMLNELFGEQILPTSPIPTSANIVEMRHGEDQVTLVLTNGEEHTFTGFYSDQELQELCKNGEDVIAVQVSRQSIHLPDGVSLLDTPGVDSTDDAHRLATESALHMADLIVFMMDYNHVQSEGNLQFLKDLAERSKKIYIVINQIDKHRDKELSFVEYQQSVNHTFQNWDLEVAGIYYTSLRDPNHKYNELDQLKSDLFRWIENRTALSIQAVDAEATYLMGQYMKQIGEHQQEKRKAWEQVLEDSGILDHEVDQHVQEHYQQQNVLFQRLEEVQLAFIKGLDEVCKNAYLMPSEVRELGREYLESLQSDFKVGFLFSKGKTDQEKQRRANAFLTKLQQTVKTQLELHVRNYIIQFCKQHDLFDEVMGQRVMSETLKWDQTLLENAYKAGAGITGNAVLNYTEDVANQLKRLARNWAIDWERNYVIPTLEKQIEAEQAKLDQEAILLQRVEEARHHLQQIEQDLALENKLLQKLWKEPNLSNQLDLTWLETKQNRGTTNSLRSTVQLWQELTQGDQSPLSMGAKLVIEKEEPMKEKEKQVVPSTQELTAFPDSNERNRAFLQRVMQLEESLREIRGVQTVLEEIRSKRERAEQKQFTVALFGAFSAGKSSFANALMGDAVLPVSPNPMTATINKICPPNEIYSHGQVVLKVKSSDTLLSELSQIYRLFEKEVLNLEQAIQRIPDLLQIKNLTPQQKTLIPFLQALHGGMEWFEPQLGSEIQIPLEQMNEYVANEKKSCFIEYANLYYDCALTRQGITLVDTPGADSVHARHTGVAFEYIRNADVILFVTYYNHAFSKADREFLIQLGRVKDSFAMDKMFFITNAADLASSEEELVGVQAYLAHQLLRFGIREPRMFAVSSLWGLAEKCKEEIEIQNHSFLQDSGFATFEQAFARFVHHDLMNLSLHSIYQDFTRALQIMKQMIVTAQVGMEEKQARKRELEQELIQVHKLIAIYETGTDQQALQQEIHELFYYVQQRWFLRFLDEFPAVFHPGSLREDLGDIKSQLKACFLEMIQFLQHDLLQEYRATTLRIEKWIRTQLEQHIHQLGSQISAYPARYQWHTELAPSFAMPELTGVMEKVEVHSFKKEMSYYRNAKAFFEKKERFQMRDAMKQRLEELVIPEMISMEKKCEYHFQRVWQGEIKRLQAIATQQSFDYYQDLQAVLNEHIDLALYQQVETTIDDFVQQWKGILI